MDACVALKNRLYDQINVCRAEGNIDGFHKILDTLDAVKEMWEAAHYSYKGDEIAKAVCENAGELKALTHNWKRLKRLDTLIARGRKMQDEFYCRQQAYLFPQVA